MNLSTKMRRGWPWLAVLLLAALAAEPLWGLPPQGDDLLLHYFRIPLVNSQWAAGLPLARWQPDLIYGYGSPLFNFYPPLSALLLTGLYWLVGQQAAVAINLAFALCLLLGAVGMFGLGRSLVGEAGGLLATAVFTLSPHLAAQIYSRASISNSLALALVPLVAWLLWRVGERPASRRIAWGAVGVALLLLSHTAASLLLLGPLLVWGLVALVRPAEGSLRNRIVAWLALFGLGLFLSAFAWLPALTEIHFTRYAVEAAKVNYAEHFSPLWGWPGLAVNGLRNAHLPKTVGLITLLLGAVGTAVSGFALWRWRSLPGKRPFPSRKALFLTAGLLGWLVLFLTTPAADWVWRLVRPLQDLQFPWRLLDVPAFFLPLASLGILPPIGDGFSDNRAKRRGWMVLGLGAVVAISYVNLIPYLYPPRHDGLPARPTLADVTAVQQTHQIFGLTAWGEYSHASVAAWPAGTPFPGADSGAPLGQKLLTAVSDDHLALRESTPWRADWQTAFDQPQQLTLATHYFPGWKAELDGAPLLVTPDEYGRLQLTVPAGDHRLAVWFGRTPIRWFADILAAAGGLIVLFLLLRKNSPGRRQWTAQPRQPGGAWLIVLLASLLLATKVGWLNQTNTALVVQPENGRIPGIPAPEAGSFNDEIRLVGAVVGPPDGLTLYWWAIAGPTKAYRVMLTLLDGQGVPRQTVINPTPGYTVASHWLAGQFIRDEYRLPLPDQAPAGYTVQLSLVQPDSEQPLPIVDAAGDTTMAVARVKQPPPKTAVPDQALPVGTIFGDIISLSYANLPETLPQGDPFDFTLYWQAEAEPQADYTVFVHLLKQEGEFVAGQDSQPLGGLYPTSFWEPGEMIADGRSWPLDVPPGEYQVQVGLYLLATGERLMAAGLHSELGDRVVVQTLTITER